MDIFSTLTVLQSPFVHEKKQIMEQNSSTYYIQHEHTALQFLQIKVSSIVSCYRTQRKGTLDFIADQDISLEKFPIIA